MFVVHEGAGSVCINATENSSNGNFSLENRGSGALGITQASVSAMSTDNGGVQVDTTGTISFDCLISTD